MWRTGLIVSVALALLLGGMQVGNAMVQDYPKVVLLKGFWFADGVLADDPRYMDWQVIPSQPVTLYEYPSLTTAVVGQLSPGIRARIQDIAFEAYPGLQEIRATGKAASQDGQLRVDTGDVIRLVCYQGDALAAYAGDELVLLDAYGLKLMDQIRPEWRGRLSGENQWLQLWTPEGKVGWAKFYAPGTHSSLGRWQIQPWAVGGRSNLNTIIFSVEMPSFQRLPLLQSR